MNISSKDQWSPKEVDQLEIGFLHSMLSCHNEKSSAGATAYAAYLAETGITSDNYPAFMRLLHSGHEEVCNALLQKSKPENFFKDIQINNHILSQCFFVLRSWIPGKVFEKSQAVILSVIERVYKNPFEGYRLYPLSISDLHHLAKHLNESKKQSDPINRLILTFLSSIGELHTHFRKASTKEIEDLATQANNIRANFMDETKSLKESIPENILKAG